MSKLKEKLKNKIRNFLGITNVLKAKIVNSDMHEKARAANLAYVLNSTVDKYTSIGRYTNVLNAEIGKFCSISYFCTIGATRHPMERISTNAFPYIKAFGFVDFDKKFTEKVYVGNDVWIGANAIIKPGVHIGDGAVIGAGAVVTKDVSPYMVVAGVPAKPIDLRFSAEIIEQLLKLKWWDFDEKIIKDNIDLFQQDLTVEIVEKLIHLKANNLGE